MTQKVISTGGYPVEVLTPDDATGGQNVTSNDITDATDTGKQLLTAENAAAARKAVGAGTSDLKTGTAATDAKPGDYQPAAADITDATDIGKKILTAKDAAAVKTLLGIS